MPRRLTVLIAFALASGTALMLIGTLDNLDASYRAGLMLWLAGSLSTVAFRWRIGESVIENVRQISWDEGFVAGCNATMRAGLADGARPLAVVRPSQKLVEQGDLRGVADRVN